MKPVTSNQKYAQYEQKKATLTKAVANANNKLKTQYAGTVSGTAPRPFSVTDSSTTMTVRVLYKPTNQFLDTEAQINTVLAGIDKEYRTILAAVNAANSAAGAGGKKLITMKWYDGKIVATYGGQVATRTDVIKSWAAKAKKDAVAQNKANTSKKYFTKQYQYPNDLSHAEMVEAFVDYYGDISMDVIVEHEDKQLTEVRLKQLARNLNKITTPGRFQTPIDDTPITGRGRICIWDTTTGKRYYSYDSAYKFYSKLKEENAAKQNEELKKSRSSSYGKGDRFIKR